MISILATMSGRRLCSGGSDIPFTVVLFFGKLNVEYFKEPTVVLGMSINTTAQYAVR